MIDFEDSFKIRVFDKLANEYFERNFGSLSKSDLETLLFSEYIEYLIDKRKDFDDYTLSKQLGVTQTRIRSLKERKELKYPIDPDGNGEYWKKSFVKSIDNAKYDDEKKRIIIPIQDINVLIEIRHQIENLGWYDEYQLNKKLLTINMNCFVDLCNSLSQNNELFTKEVKSRIRELALEEGVGKELVDFASDITMDGLKSFVMNASGEIICEVLKLIPFGGVAGALVKGTIKAIEKG